MSEEKINKLIHEKLMGGCWHECEPYSRQCINCEEWAIPLPVTHPDYCNSISDAFIAVEKMREKYEIYFTFQTHNNCVSAYRLEDFGEHQKCAMDFIGNPVFADSLPLAISTAIARILEEGKKDE